MLVFWCQCTIHYAGSFGAREGITFHVDTASTPQVSRTTGEASFPTAVGQARPGSPQSSRSLGTISSFFSADDILPGSWIAKAYESVSTNTPVRATGLILDPEFGLVPCSAFSTASSRATDTYQTLLLQYDTQVFDISQYIGQCHQRFSQYYVHVPLSVSLYRYNAALIGTFPASPSALMRIADLAGHIGQFMSRHDPQAVVSAPTLSRLYVNNVTGLNTLLRENYGADLTSVASTLVASTMSSGAPMLTPSVRDAGHAYVSLPTPTSLFESPGPCDSQAPAAVTVPSPQALFTSPAGRYRYPTSSPSSAQQGLVASSTSAGPPMTCLSNGPPQPSDVRWSEEEPSAAGFLASRIFRSHLSTLASTAPSGALPIGVKFNKAVALEVYRFARSHDVRLVYEADRASEPLSVALRNISLGKDPDQDPDRLYAEIRAVTAPREKESSFFAVPVELLFLLPDGMSGAVLDLASDNQAITLTSILPDVLSQAAAFVTRSHQVSMTVLRASVGTRGRGRGGGKGSLRVSDPLRRAGGAPDDGGGNDDDDGASSSSNDLRPPRGGFPRRRDDDSDNGGDNEDPGGEEPDPSDGVSVASSRRRGRSEHRHVNPFEKWQPEKVQKYSGECYIADDISIHSAFPHRWLDHFSQNISFANVKRKFWTFGAIMCVSLSVRQRFMTDAEIAGNHATWQPWSGDQIRRIIALPSEDLNEEDPFSWSHFSSWLKGSYTSPSFYQQLEARVFKAQWTTGRLSDFNVMFKTRFNEMFLCADVLEDSQKIQPDDHWLRDRYLTIIQTGSPTLHQQVMSWIVTRRTELEVSLTDGSLDSRSKERLIIRAGMRDPPLETIMTYAAQLDTGIGFQGSKVAEPSRPSPPMKPTTHRSQPGVYTRRPLLTNMAEHSDSPDAPSRFEELPDDDEQFQSSDADAPGVTTDALYNQMVRNDRVMWSRMQLKTLREKNLCFNCAKPDCQARTCKNRRANPASFVVNAMSLDSFDSLPEEERIELHHALCDLDKAQASSGNGSVPLH